MEKLYELFLKSSGVCTDSRVISKKSLFICLKGANFDGNTFAQKALESGALAVVSDDEANKDIPNCHIVKDSLLFLQQLANHHRMKFTIPIIGITGSNGKTTTKELIAAILSKGKNVHFTVGNLNNHIGVPLTLLKLNSEHEIAIIEMGANKFKDIEELSNIAEPTHGIITNIGKAHLEGFINFEGVLKTKTELYTAINAVGGTIFYNGDDDVLKNNLPSTTDFVTYGQKESNDIQGKLIRLSPFVELTWQSDAYQSHEIKTGMVGEYNFYNYLAAIAIGKFFGIENEQINTAIAEYMPSNNRSQVQKTDKNTLIVDCYNANPTSMMSALRSFVMIDHPNKLAILGDMREMGAEETKEHQIIIDFLSDKKVLTILVGEVFHKLASGTFTCFTTVEDLLSSGKLNQTKDALVLLKGSRGIQLEKVIEEF